jgi:hypothetical protein
VAPTIERVLGRRLPRRITDVVERMRAIDGALPAADGIACFNKLYLAVTENVAAAVGAGTFRDPRFLSRFDVVFANLYFTALRGFLLGKGPRPHAWQPLIDSRRRRRIMSIQFALAGMNAHVNRDLPVALVEAWRAFSIEPHRPSPQYDDFQTVNAILAATEERVKILYSTGAVGRLDRDLGRADDVLAMWKVERAREAAWVNGETLWALSSTPRVRAEFLRSLDRMVGFAGRGLLRPLPHLAATPARRMPR